MDIIEKVLSFFGVPIYSPANDLQSPPAPPPKHDPTALPGGIGDPRPQFPNVFTDSVAPHTVGGATDSDAIAPITGQVSEVAKKIGAPAIAAGGAALTAGGGAGAVSAATAAAGTAAVGVGIAADAAAAVLAVDAMIGGNMADKLGATTNFNNFTPAEISQWQKAGCGSDETKPPCSQIAGRVMDRQALGTKQIMVNGEFVTVGGHLPLIKRLQTQTPEEFGTFHGEKNAPHFEPNDDPTDDPNCLLYSFNGIPFDLESRPIEQMAARVSVPTQTLASAIPMIRSHPTAQPSTLQVISKPRRARPGEAPTERLDPELISTTRRVLGTGTFLRVKEEGE